MRIQTEYMSLKNHWMISSSYDFQTHQQHSQRRWFSQTTQLQFMVLADWSLVLRDMLSALWDISPALPDLSLPLWGAPRLLLCTPRCSQMHPKFSPALRGVPKPNIITPMVLRYQSGELPVTLTAGRNALLGSDTLLKLMHLSLHSTSSQTLLEASRD